MQTNIKLPCRHLLHKEMFYEVDLADKQEATDPICWCGLTQQDRGPDGLPVGKTACSANRRCFE